MRRANRAGVKKLTVLVSGRPGVEGLRHTSVPSLSHFISCQACIKCGSGEHGSQEISREIEEIITFWPLMQSGNHFIYPCKFVHL